MLFRKNKRQPCFAQAYKITPIIYLCIISNGRPRGELYKVDKDIMRRLTVSFVNSVWSSWGWPFRGWKMDSSKPI